MSANGYSPSKFFGFATNFSQFYSLICDQIVSSCYCFEVTSTLVVSSSPTHDSKSLSYIIYHVSL